MLQWNELRITPDGKYLIIDVEVQNLDFYEDIYINTLWMEVLNEPEDYPSQSKKFYLWKDYNATTLPEEDYSYTGENGKHYRRVRKFIDIDSIGDNIFFVHATAGGEVAEDTPCGCKNNNLDGITYNKRLLYNNAIGLIPRQCDCTPNDSFIDFILQTKGFELSLELGDYESALKYWNSVVKKHNVFINRNCGCK